MQRASMFPLLPHYPQDNEIELFGKMVQGKTVVAGTGYTAATGEAELKKAPPNSSPTAQPFSPTPTCHAVSNWAQI